MSDSSSEEPTSALPVTISHYRIVQKLRSGGMGDVYLAEDEILPRVIALKLLPEKSGHDQLLQHRFMREARAASALSHANIARVYEAGYDGSRLFIAMEYVEGESLDRRMLREQPSIDAVIGISIQLAAALSEAHNHGIVHRDIKPANVMITARDEVKVLDFGLAKLTDSEVDLPSDTSWKTQSGLLLGTVPYMSPEQALGKEADPRSDIFSLGILMYEMVTRRLPFAGTTPADTMYRITNAQPESMLRFNYELPLELERIIRKCLEKEPLRRYQSAPDLLVDLRNLNRDRQMSLHPHARAARVGRWVNGKRAAVWAGVLVMTALTSVLLWRRPAAVRPARIHQIAVLPFQNAGHPSFDYLSDGVSEMLINNLAQVPEFKVKAWSTSFRYRDTASPTNAGRALHVDAVLTGVITATDDHVTVSAELVNVRDGTRLGGTRIETTSSDIPTIAQTIGTDILRALGIQTPAATRAAGQEPPINVEAYRLYLQGRHQWNTRTAEGLRAAIELFRQSIEIEPRFAPAYAGLADSYALLERYAGVPTAQARDRAVAAARHAVEFGPSLPEAHVSLASVHATYAWDWASAEAEYKTAIRLSPSYATAHHWYALLLTRLGRFDAALEEIRIARELDPLSPAIAAAVANIHYYRGDYDRSIQEARAALAWAPEFVPARLQLILSLAFRDDTATALTELKALPSQSAQVAAVRALVAARAGRIEDARRFIRATTAAPDAAASAYAAAAILALIGENREAVAFLNRAADAQSIWVGYAAVDPSFATLRHDAEFAKVLARLHLPSHV